MKIRTGYVSNSSSSNFIVSGNDYNTVFELAVAMLEIRNRDSDLTYEQKEKWSNEIKQIAYAVDHGRDPDSAISFPTCNYDTFIKKVCGNYIVTSCKNEPFKQNLEGTMWPTKEMMDWLEEKGYIRDDDSPHLPFDEVIDTWRFQCDEVFWYPIYDLDMSKFDHFAQENKTKKGNIEWFCGKDGHYCDKGVLASTGETICPACYIKEQSEKEKPNKDRFGILDIREKDED